MSNVKKVYITKEQLAERWQLPTRPIENMVADGRCPKPTRLGYKTIRWDLAVIEKFENKLT